MSVLRSHPTPFNRPPALSRPIVIAGSVILFHLAALWALQNGLLRRAIEVVIPVEILSQLIELPTPKAVPPPPSRVLAQQSAAKATPHFVTTPPPPPQLLAMADPTPSHQVPTGVLPTALPTPLNANSAVPTTASTAATPVIQSTAAHLPPASAAAKLELPSSDAEYLQNPRPAYPPLSKRLGEQGKVLVRVFIATDGAAQKAEIRESSGYERLDQVALSTVLKWRYVPGKRDGTPESMWFVVPVNFVLE